MLYNYRYGLMGNFSLDIRFQASGIELVHTVISCAELWLRFFFYFLFVRGIRCGSAAELLRADHLPRFSRKLCWA